MYIKSPSSGTNVYAIFHLKLWTENPWRLFLFHLMAIIQTIFLRQQDREEAAPSRYLEIAVSESQLEIERAVRA